MEIIRDLRKKNKLTQRKLADKLSISRSAVSMWEIGASQPDPAQIVRLADIFGISADYLLGRIGEKDAPASTGGVWIPVLGDVAAGVPIEAVEDILDYEEIAASVAACGEHFALRIKGESMAPRMATGDVVIVRCQSDVENGEVAVVVVNGDSATVKKIKKSPDGMALVPTNPACEVMIYTNEQIAELPVTIIGKIVELRAKF